MKIKGVQDVAKQFVKENATTILTAGGVVGTVTTAVLTGRAAIKAHEIIKTEEERRHTHRYQAGEETEPLELTKTQKLVLAGPHFIPPVLAGTATVASIIFANRMSAQKAAALAAAYGLSKKEFDEYKAKVAEKLGVQKEQKVQDDLAQDRVNKTPGAAQIVVVEGEVLCFDQPTGRYFRSTMEKIKKAVNSINAEILHHDHASANYFYEELELPPTTWGDEVGFNSDNLVELTFSTVMSLDDKPCIAIDFVRLPTMDYMRKMY